MRTLTFEPVASVEGGRRVRRARFEERSVLPMSAACLTANGVREHLAQIFGVPIALRLIAPVIPDRRAWQTLASQAHVYAVRGSVSEAAFVVRPDDALALAAGLFQEEGGHAGRSLSRLESEVLERALRRLAGALTPVCGTEPSRLERILDIRGFTTYFELLVSDPVRARIGVALSREPQANPIAQLRIEDLADVEIELTVELARGSIPAAHFLALGPASEVPMMTKMADPGLLKLGSAVLARGQCGVAGSRCAMMLSGQR